jgi:hypothetical protein
VIPVRKFLLVTLLLAIAWSRAHAGTLVENSDLFVDGVILNVMEKREGTTQQAVFRAKVVHTYSAENRHKVGDEVDVLGVLDTYVYLNDLQPGATCQARMRPVEKSKKKARTDGLEVWDIERFVGVNRPGAGGGIGNIKQIDLDSMSPEMKEYLIQMGAQNITPPTKNDTGKK